MTLFLPTKFLCNKVSANFFFQRDKVSTGQSFYGTKSIRGQGFYGDKVSTGQSFYGDKVSTGQSFYTLRFLRDKVSTPWVFYGTKFIWWGWIEYFLCLGGGGAKGSTPSLHNTTMSLYTLGSPPSPPGKLKIRWAPWLEYSTRQGIELNLTLPSSTHLKWYSISKEVPVCWIGPLINPLQLTE